ncbi:MAG: flagellar biosynthetic protein FliQ [Planctomycetaceae bacterium]|nr:flagellar biosynthetic protein FliQ [Planctomycetaceae bacterium]
MFLVVFDPVQQAIDVVQSALMLTVILATPILAIGLVVGLIVAIFQTATSIQEQTLAFIPKMFAVAALLVLLFPWMARSLLSYTDDLWTNKMPVFLTRSFGLEDVTPPQ